MASTTVAPATNSSTILQDHKDQLMATSTSKKSLISQERLDHYNDWPNAAGFEPQYEQHTPVELKIHGHIPAYVAGVLYRTGPGAMKVEGIKNDKTFKIDHWFDGFSQVHRFNILPPSSTNPSTTVHYNSRLTTDTLTEEVRKTGSLGGFSFGQKRDPCQSLFKKVMTSFASTKNFSSQDPSSQNVGVTVSVNMAGIKHPEPQSDADLTLTIKTDANMYQLIDAETLAPYGICNQEILHPDLKGPFSGAHAKTCPITGEVFNYNLQLAAKPTYRIFCVSPSTQKTTVIATIKDAAAAYLHSIFLTPNYVILCVWNSHYASRGLSLIWHQNILDGISPLDPSKPCRWYVIDRSPARRGVLATYESPAFFCFHTVNAYEEPSSTHPGQTDVVADLVYYPDLSIIKRFYYDNMISSSPGARNYVGKKADMTRPRLGRYRLHSIPSERSKGIKTAVQEFLLPYDQGLELPTLSPRVITKPHRYIYGVTLRGSSSFFDGLTKFDVVTKDSIYWQEKGQSAGEAIFIPNPEGTEEDDGVLLTVVLDGYAEKSYLLCLDAKNLKEVGRADMEGVVGFGFHGTHVPSIGKDSGKALDL